MDITPMVIEPFAEATPTRSAELLALASTRTASGDDLLSEEPRLRLRAGSGAPCGIAAVRFSADGPLVAAAVGVGPADPSGPEMVWTIEVVAPSAGELPPAAVARLVAEACDGARRNGATVAMLWQPVDGPALEAIAPATLAWTERRLVELRRPLPVPDARPGARAPLRAFRPGVDEEAWVAANNRAFADHPEQGHWTVDQVRAREEEDWFDPEGFLVLDDGEVVGAACWTKIHLGTAPLLGEIYVIFVDPRLHGQGLGRALLHAGLASLHERGARRASLHVEADNEPALALYRSAGFGIHHVQRALRIALT